MRYRPSIADSQSARNPAGDVVHFKEDATQTLVVATALAPQLLSACGCSRGSQAYSRPRPALRLYRQLERDLEDKMDKEGLADIFARHKEARIRTSERYVMLDVDGRTFYFLPSNEGGQYDGYSEEGMLTRNDSLVRGAS